MSVSLRKSTDAPQTLPGLSEADALATLTPADADRFRIVVTPDTDAEGPQQWGLVGIVGVARHTGGGSHSDVTPDDDTDPHGLAAALDRMSDGIVPPAGHWVARSESAEAVIRWARIFHGVTVVRWYGNVSQGSMVDALVYLEPDVHAVGDENAAQALAAYVSTLQQWAEGDVSTVSLQRNVSDDLSDPSADDWEPVGDLFYLGGCYLEHGGESGDYTAAACVADNWGVPRDFADALEVVHDYS